MRELEDDVARRVEAILARDFGIALGARQRRDGLDDSGLTVDFTYEAVGHAIEITTTPDATTADGVAAAKLADRLSEAASGWIVVVESGTRMRDLDTALLELMAAGAGIRPSDYNSEDLDRWHREGRLPDELERRDRLKQLGIIELVRAPTVEGVEAMVMGDMRTFGGTTPQLEQAVDANSKKLAACRPRRTHLVVGLAEFGVSRDPTATDVPELPPSIDDLWVVHLWTGVAEQRCLWHVARGDHGWSIHDEDT